MHTNLKNTNQQKHHDTKDNTLKSSSSNTYSIKRLLVSIVMCLISIISLIITFIYYINLNNSIGQSKTCLGILYMTTFSSIWFGLDVLVVYYSIKIKERCDINFSSSVIINNTNLLKIIFTMMIFSMTISVIKNLKENQKDKFMSNRNRKGVTLEKSEEEENKNGVIGDNDTNIESNITKKGVTIKISEDEENKNDETEDKNIKKKKSNTDPVEIKNELTFDFKEESVIFYSYIFGSILLVYFIKLIILQFLNYKIHYDHFKDRIDKNNMRIRNIMKLDKEKEFHGNIDIKNWAIKIYNNLKQNKSNILRITDFKNVFGEKDGNDLFKLFDKNLDNTVDQNEFVEKTQNIFNEKKKLKKTLIEKNKTIKKLQYILSILFLPLIILLILILIGKVNTFKLIFKTLAALLFPVSFVFKSVLADIFESILFIFTVRPFDIGDTIRINKKDYEVYEMGFLYATLISDSRFINFPNETLRKNPVTNLRKSKFVSAVFEQEYTWISSKDKINMLKEKIGIYIKENTKLYNPVWSVSNLRFDNNESIKLDISVQLNCSYQNKNLIQERRDVFNTFLLKIVEDIGIIIF